MTDNVLTTQATKHQEQLDYLRRILLAPIYDVAIESDLTYLTKLSSRLNNHIYLKREDQQPVHSFKLRGAYNKLNTLSEDQCIHGVMAAPESIAANDSPPLLVSVYFCKPASDKAPDGSAITRVCSKMSLIEVQISSVVTVMTSSQ